MRPIAISGFETERAGALKLLAWGAVAAVVGYIFFATLQPAKKKS